MNYIKFKNYSINCKIINGVEMLDVYTFLKQYNINQTVKKYVSKWLRLTSSLEMISIEERMKYSFDLSNSGGVKMNIPGKYKYDSCVAIYVNYEIFLHILNWCNESLCHEFSNFYENRKKQKDNKKSQQIQDDSIEIKELKQAYNDLYSIYDTVQNNHKKLKEDYQKCKNTIEELNKHLDDKNKLLSNIKKLLE